MKILKISLILFILSSVSACSMFQKDVVYKTQVVEKPIAVSCVNKDEIPEKTTPLADTLSKEDSIFEKGRTLIVDNKTLETENEKLRILIEACILEK